MYNNNVNYSYFNGQPIQGMTQMPYGNMPMGGFNGVTYGQQTPIKFTNPLPQDVINENLKNGKGLPNLNITKEDFEMAICTHRNPATNQITAYPMNDGTGRHKCSICGAEFHVIEGADPEDIKLAADNLWDIGQTAKMLWIDGSNDAIKQAFQILAIIPKIPALYTIASNTMQRYNGGFTAQNIMNNPQNAAALVNQIFGGPVAGFNMNMMNGLQPMPAVNMQGMMNPQMNMGMAQQPMMNPAQQQMLAGAPGISNGFGYTNPGMPTQQTGQYNMNLDPNAQLQNQQQVQQQSTPQPAPAPSSSSSTNATVTETLHV